MSTGMTKSAELRLIRQAAAGDSDAATALIRTHQSSVFAYIKRMAGRDETAEDVTQEAFTRVLLNLDRFDPKYRFSTWLFTIARRIFLNMVEKKKPVCDCDRLTNTVWAGRDIGSDAEDEERHDSERERLQQSLLAVSREQRDVLVLFHQHEWPIWMIADQLGIPEGTVKSHLFRGRVKLRDEYLRLEALSKARAQLRRDAAIAQREPKPVLPVGPADAAELDEHKEVWS